MKQSLRLGRVAGIPVGIHWTVAVILVVITDILGSSVLPGVIPGQAPASYWIMAIAGAVLFAASLFAHEIAHALIARRKGVQVRSITLWMLGGITELEGQAATPGAEFQIAIAGPATSLATGAAFVVAALAAGMLGASTVITAALGWLATMNVLLAVFNMLPGAPLDGGRVLKAALWRRYGDRSRASGAAGQAGRYLGIAIAVAGGLELVVWRSFGGLWLILIGWFLASAAVTESRAAGIKDAMSGVRVRDIMTADPDIAPAWSTARDFTDRIAQYSRQTVFPVVAFDGALAGAVTLGQLTRLRLGELPGPRLDHIAVAVPAQYQAAPDDPAEPLFTRPPLGGELAAVVLSGGRVVGIVSTDDLRRALRKAPLRATDVGANGAERPREPQLAAEELTGHPVRRRW